MSEAPIDHCAKAQVLSGIREELISGQAVARGKFGEDDLQFARADLSRLDRLIAYHQNECDAAAGRPKRNRRYAMTAGFKNAR